MGLPVARHLMDFGYSVDIWARTPTKVAELSSAGATLCSTPATLATGSDIVFLCVFDAAAVDNVVFGAIGVAIGGFTEKLLIDHSTTHPERSREMAA
jgi:3-hydroxyisobutyrate dehydrogenase